MDVTRAAALAAAATKKSAILEAFHISVRTRNSSTPTKSATKNAGIATKRASLATRRARILFA
jgi:hypothetical protein